MRPIVLALLLAGIPQDPLPATILTWNPDPAKKYVYKTVVDLTFKTSGTARVELVEEIERLATLENGTLRLGSSVHSVVMTWTAGETWKGGDRWKAGDWSSADGKPFPYADAPFHLRIWAEATKNHWMYALSKNGTISGANVFGSLKAMREGCRDAASRPWPEPTLPYRILVFPPTAKKQGEAWDEKTESSIDQGILVLRREGKIVSIRDGLAGLKIRMTSAVREIGTTEAAVRGIWEATVTWSTSDGMPLKCTQEESHPEEADFVKFRYFSELIKSAPKDP